MTMAAEMAGRSDPPLPSSDDPSAILYADALRVIMNRDFCFSEKYREQQTRALRDNAHPEILEFERLFIKRLYKFGVPMFGHCVWRDPDTQARLYVAGKSKAKPGASPHQHGCAVDIIHGTKGWNIPDKSWAIIGHIGKELALSKGWKIEWGGDWKRSADAIVGWDPAHWQLVKWRDRARELA